MTALKLYFDFMSQPSRAVWLFLKVTGIPFEEKQVALRKGEHMTAEYAKINPFQLVPAIDDAGFRLVESFAILRYLCSSRHLPDNWYPSNLKQRAKIDSYLSWHHLNTRIFGAQVFRIQVIEPKMKNIPIDKEKLAKYELALENTLENIEKVWLRDTPFICGSSISIADVMCICELMQPYATGYPVWEGHPKLAAWAERVEEQLQPHFDRANVMVHKVRENFLASKM